MAVSAFDLFSIGIGPSSSHTVGPMRAARRFVERLAADQLLDRTVRIKAQLFGSLGATGHGHGSDKAVLWGLEGEDPETIDTRLGPFRIAEIAESARIRLNGTHQIGIHLDNDVILHRRLRLPYHPNGMTFAAYDSADDAGAGVDLLLDRRRVHRGGRRRGPPGRRPRSDPGAVRLPHRRRAARPLRRHRPADQRRDARQRVRPPSGGRGPGGAAADLVGDGRVRPQRLRDGRRAAGRTQGQAPGQRALRPTEHQRGRWTRSRCAS